MQSASTINALASMNNLRLLEFALALDQHRSFKRAAEAMRLTQPSFSRAIASLETQLGARLFDRSNRGVSPTPEGSELLVRARRLLADAAGLRDALDDYRQLRSGRVVIGAGPYALDLSVIETVVRLATEYPRLQIEIIEGHWRDFGTRLLNAEVELAVVELSIVAKDPRFQVEPLPTHAGCFYSRAGHPLAGRKGVTLAELLEYPLVNVRIASRTVKPGQLQPSPFAIDALSGDMLPSITTTSIATARAIIKRTNGIGLAAPVQLAEDLRLGAVAIIDAGAGMLRSSYGIACLRGKVLSPGAQAFVSLLKAVEANMQLAAPGKDKSARASTGPRRKRRPSTRP
jgi:DNA-binding transcriptional LysR family regulator